MLLWLFWGCGDKVPQDSGTDDSGTQQIIDIDGDGFVQDEDCDDYNPEIFPGASEIPNDGVDQDCDEEDLLAPSISLASAGLLFQTKLGCMVEQELTLQNVGMADLSITGIEILPENQNFTLVVADLLPVAPLSEKSIAIQYTPTEVENISYTLEIYSDDFYNPTLSIPLEVASSSHGTITQSHIQADANSPRSVDVLFAADTTPSMYSYLSDFTQEASVLFSSLSDEGLDYRVSVVSHASGCIQGSNVYVDNSFSASDAQQVVEEMVNASSTYGSGYANEAFYLFETALDQTDSAECNAGMIREEAILALVGVSDQEEESSGSYETYVNALQGTKSDASDVIFYGFGEDGSGTCPQVEVYTGIVEATTMSEGAFFPICEPFSDTFVSLAAHIAQRAIFRFTEIPLEALPVESSLIVQLDGTELNNGWAYDAVQNVIIFDENLVIADGSEIEIFYEEQGTCP